IDVARNEVTVRDGKGLKDRVTMLPASCKQTLLAHLEKVRQLHEADLRRGLGRAPLPDALGRKYPNADRSWAWQYVFPASSHYTCSTTGLRHRHDVHETVIQKVRARGSLAGRYYEACKRPYFSPLLRHPPARRRLYHPSCSRT